MKRLRLVTMYLLVLLASACAAAPETVVVAGASGRTGGYVLEELRAAGYNIRALTSNRARAIERKGAEWPWLETDVRDIESLRPALVQADFVICVIGAREWSGPNSPQFVDYGGVRNLVDVALEQKITHFVLISSAAAGPYRNRSRMEQMGNVRYWKTRGEDHLKLSGLRYTIIGPGGLQDTGKSNQGLRLLSRADYRGGAIARGDVAMLAVESFSKVAMHNKTFAAVSDAGLDAQTWRQLLDSIELDANTEEAAPTAEPTPP